MKTQPLAMGINNDTEIWPFIFRICAVSFFLGETAMTNPDISIKRYNFFVIFLQFICILNNVSLLSTGKHRGRRKILRLTLG
jgi:hypothetical protein